MLQQEKQNIFQRANERGIFNVRRTIASESQGVYVNFLDKLQLELRSSARLYNPRRIGVTVIGFSRFNKSHLETGPSSESVTSEVETTLSPLDVRLGHLVVYGSDTKNKLAISLISDDLIIEEARIVSEFEKKDYPIRQRPNNPHTTIALLNRESVELFQEGTALQRLEEVMGIDPDTEQWITLNPTNSRGSGSVD